MGVNNQQEKTTPCLYSSVQKGSTVSTWPLLSVLFNLGVAAPGRFLPAWEGEQEASLTVALLHAPLQS